MAAHGLHTSSGLLADEHLGPELGLLQLLVGLRKFCFEVDAFVASRHHKVALHPRVVANGASQVGGPLLLPRDFATLHFLAILNNSWYS